MRKSAAFIRRKLALFLVFALPTVGQTVAAPQQPQQTARNSPPAVESRRRHRTTRECDSCIRRNLSYLAGPALHGRGSGTEDEHNAAEFIAKKLKQYGLSPAAEDGSFIQTATIQSRSVRAPPTLSIEANDATQRVVTWEHGKGILVSRLSQPDIAGVIQKLDLADPKITPEMVEDGAVLLLRPAPGYEPSELPAAMRPYQKSKAVMIIVPQAADSGKSDTATKLPRLPKKIGNQEPPTYPALVSATAATFEQLWAAADGSVLKLHTEVSAWATTRTWNVLGKLVGEGAGNQIVLLSAHLDHLGVRDGKTFPGADDDASGTAAVMELARAIGIGGKPRRTLIFALWGSEELGMLGSRYFLEHPTFELKDIVANLEFEMIGRRDPKVRRKQLWLTGWDRTDLGPELAAHGARLVADPHPEEHFFTRSDNYALAKEGLIAQTVSSFGLHKDYHEPSDTLKKLDWRHLDRAIGSMIAPVTWLVNSDFVPQWKEGKRPEP